MALLSGSQHVIITSLFPTIAEIELEASIMESHRRVADLTEHPVEEGADVVDHIRFKPREVEITGIISNTPIRTPLIEPVLPSVPGGDPASRAEDAFAKLEEIMETGSLCLISTTLRQYEGMALVSLTTPRDSARGHVAELQMSFREVRIAETERVAAATPKTPSRSPRANVGKASAKAASAAEQAKTGSLLSQLFSFFG